MPSFYLQIFIRSTHREIRPAHYSFKRRGAPKHNWHDQIFQRCLRITGGLQQLRYAL